MNRETTNRIRFVIEDILPPAVRDSQLFRRAAKMANTVLVPKGVGLAVGQFGKSKQNLSEALAAARG